jgi:hypothetical protein
MNCSNWRSIKAGCSVGEIKAMPRIEWAEIDGVPVMWAEESAVPGPLQACLMFGVGRGDETMALSGVTHLVEHLALHRLGTVPYGWNGQVTPVTTRFAVMGSGEQINDFFAHVVRQLADLPVDRIEDEARVLRIEGERRGTSQVGSDLSLRFGAQGAGLLGWPEHGLNRLDAEDVMTWSKTWFTADNTVLWLSGPIPPGLSLAGLPTTSRPLREVARAVPLQPWSWAAMNTKTVSVSLVSDQQWAILPTMEVARQRALERLRARDAISYAVEFAHLRIGGGRALEYLAADGAPGSYDKILDGLRGVVGELADGGPSIAELDGLKAQRAHLREHPNSLLAYLDSASERHLLGLPATSWDEIEEKWNGLTPAQARDELSDLIPTTLAIGPSEVGEDVEGWSTVTTWSRERVGGREFLPITGREKGVLAMGDDGLTWALDEARYRSVRWADAVACFVWDNGRRQVVGPCGAFINVVPWNWQGGEVLTSLVDEYVDSSVRIRLGEGATQYPRNPNDPESVADVHWLGTIVGALHGVDRVDVVIDTDGLFLLYGRHTPGTIPLRLKELRTSGREELLGSDPRNRWLPQDTIEHAKVTKNPLARVNRVKGTLRIATPARKPIRIDLVRDDQLRIVRDDLRRLLGSRLHA